MRSGIEYQRHAKTILLTVIVIVIAAVSLVSKSLIELKQVETYWMEHVQKSNTITAALASVRHHLGYGGFIHNFKNLVLRQDVARYQLRIEQNILELQNDLAKLHKLLDDPASITALLQLQHTVTEYQSKYYLALRMLSQQHSISVIDAQVKVDDGPALASLATLDDNLALQSSALINDARARNQTARRFMLYGSLLLLPLIVIAIAFIISLLKRLIVINRKVIANKELAEQNLQQQKAMRDELVQQEKMAALGKLVAGVAHEINTPVGIMLTAASHLQLESETINQQLHQEKLGAKQLTAYLQTTLESSGLICSCCNRAAELIQSFKQVAVDQAGAVKREFDMAAYLNEVVQSLKPSFKKRPISLHINCPPGIVLDSYPGTVAQILTNLILNSLRHAFAEEDTGNISVTINKLEQPDNWLEWVYEDDGAGIAVENQSKVFEPFFTTSRQQGGSGLGLHVVYSCVTQVLQGSIVMSSTPGQGTCFIIRMPLSVQQNAAEQASDL